MDRLYRPSRAARGFRIAAAATLVAVALPSAACFGRKLKFNEAKLAKRCGVTAGVRLTEDRALCIARLAGLRDTRKCPLEIAGMPAEDRPDGVYHVRESCGAVGLFITLEGGRVVGVELGTAVVTAPTHER
jgi:hypothetical protein